VRAIFDGSELVGGVDAALDSAGGRSVVVVVDHAELLREYKAAPFR
jgi:hypothetical protein